LVIGAQRYHAVFATAQAAEEAFYDALLRADLNAMMALWSDDDDAACVHPGGQRMVGFDAIRQAWAATFDNGGVDVRPIDVRIHQTANCAIHHLLEQVIVRNEGKQHVIQVAVVNVYVKDAAGWKLFVHHASNPLHLEQDDANATSLLGSGARAPGLLH
jgi:ketosteroid isomerase-like protein